MGRAGGGHSNVAQTGASACASLTGGEAMLTVHRHACRRVSVSHSKDEVSLLICR